MLVVRPADPADLPALMELAILSGRGFTSLPEDEPTLARRLALSEGSFSGALERGDAWYTLMLEDSETRRIEGVAAIHAAVGLKRPHFSFRVMTLAQYSSAIDTRFDHRALVLVNECGGWTEVGSLFLRPELRNSGGGGLLARSRYMLIGVDPFRFSDMVMAELRGWFDDDGSCPFWEGVASKFFRLPFDQADQMTTSTDGQFILDLAPRHPIYVELIGEAARNAIGRVHREGEPARFLLEREGFVQSSLIDIFDAGPTLTCARDAIVTVRNSRPLPVTVAAEVEGAPTLVSTATVAGFRAARVVAAKRDGALLIDREGAAALGVGDGAIVRVNA